MFLKGAWFIIAGVLLLGQTPAQADSYLRVSKKGVVYYYFASQAQPQFRRVMTASNPPATHSLAPVSAKDTRDFTPLMPETSEALPAVSPSDPKENFWAAVRYPIRWLAKLGCYYPPALPPSAALAREVGRRQDLPTIQKPPVAGPDGEVNFLKYAQEQPSAGGQEEQRPGHFMELNSGSYIFPVAGPYSFRDSWGDWRSGGRQHRAVDIFAREGTEVYAITSGVIQTLVTYPEAGNTLMLLGQDGRGYGYMHLQGYASGIFQGKAVRTGELLGYVGRTGLRNSAAHLHLQVHAGHRFCKDELRNSYNFLVQLCRGVGVKDLYHHRMARLEAPLPNVNRIQVYRRPEYTALKPRGGHLRARNSSTLVIKNF